MDQGETFIHSWETQENAYLLQWCRPQGLLKLHLEHTMVYALRSQGLLGIHGMSAATSLNHSVGETAHVCFFDVVTSSNSSEFSIVHQTERTIPAGCSKSD